MFFLFSQGKKFNLHLASTSQYVPISCCLVLMLYECECEDVFLQNWEQKIWTALKKSQKIWNRNNKWWITTISEKLLKIILIKEMKERIELEFKMNERTNTNERTEKKQWKKYYEWLREKSNRPYISPTMLLLQNIRSLDKSNKTINVSRCTLRTISSDSWTILVSQNVFYVKNVSDPIRQESIGKFYERISHQTNKQTNEASRQTSS